MITCQYNLLFLIFKLFICQQYNDGFAYKNLLKQLPFYGETIKSKIKKITNIKLLSELPFFEKPKNNNIKQLTIKKLLGEKRDFKYIISAKITLKKRINDNELELKTLYFNLLIKIVINRRYHLNG